MSSTNLQHRELPIYLKMSHQPEPCARCSQRVHGTDKLTITSTLEDEDSSFWIQLKSFIDVCKSTKPGPDDNIVEVSIFYNSNDQR